ncbi:hypothetical protein C8T65DRAFT_68928 [Cerioporus squamosus]|nr:hypothetical protein C8T65DRAFT_68928 [Cerioporus squamosus]
MSVPGSQSGRKVLDTYDILLKILEDGSSSSDESHGRRSIPTLTQRDLTACAQACRAFREPALRILWSQIDSLLPLWHLLAPAALPPPKACTEDYINLVAEAKLYEDRGCWDRFLGYTKLIRRLFHDSSVCGNSQAHLFKILLQHNGGAPFLLSLRAIEWKRASSQDYSFAFTFTQGIIDVTLSFARQGFSAQLWRYVDLKPLLQTLREASPELETFQLRIPTEADSWVVDELVQFPRLRKLYGLFTLDFPSIVTLISKVNLVSLGVTLSSDSADITTKTLSPMRMENLRELKIQSRSQSVTQLFMALTAPCLHSLTVWIIDDPDSPVEYPTFMGSIAHAVSADAMRSLNLEIYMQHYILHIPRPAPIPLATLLQPVLPLQNLETFELKFGGRLQLSATNETFADIVQKWSALRTFSLSTRDWHPDGPSPTPAILISFSRACPDLRELVLPYLDHRALVPPTGGMPAPHPLLRFDILDHLTERGSMNEDPTRMAEYIHCLFPSIDLGIRHYSRNDQFAWTKVFNRIEMLREAMSSAPALT